MIAKRYDRVEAQQTLLSYTLLVSTEKKNFKDWFDRDAAKAMAEQVGKADPTFDQQAFIKKACRGLTKLEFKDRVIQFADSLHKFLPKDPERSLTILNKSLPELLPDCDSPTDGWLQWPVGEFVARYGTEHYETSFELMTELTQRFTSEFAVRPFVENEQERAIESLMDLATHESPHVRRWCSEGLRPRLPWGTVLKGLVRDPKPILPVLELLKDDPELYVRRSVANNLNDIAKDHPELVVDLCKKWQKDSNKNRDWLIRHALRSLIKKAHPGALALQGFRKPSKLECQLTLKPKKIKIGKELQLQLELKSSAKKTQKLQVDYIVHFVKKTGKSSEKVFKWKALDIKGGETVSLSKKQVFKQTSIRVLYPGKHRIEVQVNGSRLASAEFLLT